MVTNIKRNLKVICILLICIWLDSKAWSSATCKIQNVDNLYDFLGKEIVYKSNLGLECEIKRTDFTFDLDKKDKLIKNQIHKIQNRSINVVVELKWSKNLKQSTLTRQFDMVAFMVYFQDLDYLIDVNFVNLKGFELNLFDWPLAWSTITYNHLKLIYVINSDLRFYIP